LKNGDISNETSPRIIVFADVVANTFLKESRKLLRTELVLEFSSLNNPALSNIWRVANSYGLSVELAGLVNQHWTIEMLDMIMDKLERRGGNPFNYTEIYADLEDFLGELPYRTNLKGVVDLRERVALYGSYGIELDNL
jgi:hypothetical protein